MIDKSFVKDPQAKLDYVWDWTVWLAGDKITGVSIIMPTGLTSNEYTYTDNTVTAWLEGGTAGNNYLVPCKITTNSGRIDERSILIICAEK